MRLRPRLPGQQKSILQRTEPQVSGTLRSANSFIVFSFLPTRLQFPFAPTPPLHPHSLHTGTNNAHQAKGLGHYQSTLRLSIVCIWGFFKLILSLGMFWHFALIHAWVGSLAILNSWKTMPKAVWYWSAFFVTLFSDPQFHHLLDLHLVLSPTPATPSLLRPSQLLERLSPTPGLPDGRTSFWESACLCISIRNYLERIFFVYLVCSVYGNQSAQYIHHPLQGPLWMLMWLVRCALFHCYFQKRRTCLPFWRLILERVFSLPNQVMADLSSPAPAQKPSKTHRLTSGFLCYFSAWVSTLSYSCFILKVMKMGSRALFLLFGILFLLWMYHQLNPKEVWGLSVVLLKYTNYTSGESQLTVDTETQYLEADGWQSLFHSQLPDKSYVYLK